MQNGDYTSNTSRPDRERRRRRRRQARRRLLLLVVVVVVAVGVIAAVALRGRGSAGEGSGGDTAQAAAAAKASPKPTPPPEVWDASAAHPVRVWVGGDSMGGELGWTLGPELKDTGAFRPVTFYKESSGICRYDFYDWQKEIESVMRGARPQAAVIMLGTNDTQSVWKGGKWINYGDVAWKHAYEQRVGDIIDTMLRRGARRVYWVGMPVMGESWRNKRMKFINTIFAAQAARRPGAEYIDVWDLFTRSDGSFDPSLRLSDGVHFTGEGQSKLATAVYKAIAADWHPVKPESPGASPSASATPSASASAL